MIVNVKCTHLKQPLELMSSPKIHFLLLEFQLVGSNEYDTKYATVVPFMSVYAHIIVYYSCQELIRRTLKKVHDRHYA